jgi:hypothetical protein
MVVDDAILNEFGTTLSMAHLPPLNVDEVVAGWMRHYPQAGRFLSGFVVRVRTGWAYITSERDYARDFRQASTQYFKDEPRHLYDRAEHWIHDKDRLNEKLPYNKAEAKYGVLGRSHNPTNSDAVDSASTR